MKRLFVLAVTVCMLVTLCIPVWFVTAAETPTLSMEQTSAYAGDVVQMQLSLSNNPGIVAMLATVHFDTSALHLIRVENGDVFPQSTAFFGNDLTGNSFTMTWLDALTQQNYTANGTLATLTFRVLADAAVGETAVTLTYEANNVFDWNLRPAPAFALKNGSVTVLPPPVAVTDVSVLPEALTLGVGETQKLTATVLPADATDPSVTWRSGNPNVASVDDAGNVTANTVGTAVITVTTTDGDKTATCRVTVLADKIPVRGVSLSPVNMTLKVGDMGQLLPTVTPADATDPTVTWKSSNANVASVDANGTVTAKAVGTATITVTTNDGGKTAACTVTVQPAPVSVTGVSVSPTTLTIQVGQTQKLTATVSPSNATDKTVAWKSSSENIASVDTNGNVTAKAVGTATITVTTNDGAKTATCRVTVQSATIPVTGVSVSPTSLTMQVGEKQKLTAMVSPSNATDKTVMWKSGIPNVASVDANGYVTANGAGNTTITVTTNDGKQTATCSVTVMPVQVTITKIEMRTMPTKTSYNVGDAFDQTGLTLTAFFSNGTTQTITRDFACTGFSSATAGSKTVTVTYAGKTTTFTVVVMEKAPDPTVRIHNYTSSRTLDYRTTITFSADVFNEVSGAKVHWFIDGKDSGTGDTYTAKEVKKDFIVQAKYMQSSKVLAESDTETVKVNSGFFARLKAFFRGLFGKLPVVVQEYLGVEVIDRILP